METEKSNFQWPKWYTPASSQESLPWPAHVLPEDYWAELVALQQKLIKAEWPHLFVQLITIKCVLECWWGLGHIHIEAIWERFIALSWEPFIKFPWEPLLEAFWKPFTNSSLESFITSSWGHFINSLWEHFIRYLCEFLDTSSVRVQFKPLQPLRLWIDTVEVNNQTLAKRFAKFIPSQCPFERDIVLLGRTIAHIPPLCKLNPLYDELVGLRFRSICFLADNCGEDISSLV